MRSDRSVGLRPYRTVSSEPDPPRVSDDASSSLTTGSRTFDTSFWFGCQRAEASAVCVGIRNSRPSVQSTDGVPTPSLEGRPDSVADEFPGPHLARYPQEAGLSAWFTRL